MNIAKALWLGVSALLITLVVLLIFQLASIGTTSNPTRVTKFDGYSLQSDMIYLKNGEKAIIVSDDKDKLLHIVQMPQKIPPESTITERDGKPTFVPFIWENPLGRPAFDIE